MNRDSSHISAHKSFRHVNVGKSFISPGVFTVWILVMMVNPYLQVVR